MRGEYYATDSPDFIESEEAKCLAWNCWMVRKPDGKPEYHSEPLGKKPFRHWLRKILHV